MLEPHKVPLMSWETPVPIFEDEDEEALIEEFVRLSAIYHTFPPTAVAAEIFNKLREPSRALQAATIWSSNLGIMERIRIAKANKETEGLIKTKIEWELKQLALLEDTSIGVQEKKVRTEIYNSIAKARGWLDGDMDDDEEGGRKGKVVHVNFRLDPRANPDAANVA